MGGERDPLGLGRMKLEEVRPGLELGPSAWREVTQQRIDGFAEWTDDRQWIHTDPDRAAEGPFGSTIAHGFMTLSLLVPFLDELLAVEDAALTVNYGLNRVRFPAPVPAGSRIRGRFRVEDASDVPGGAQVVFASTVEREGHDRPVCAAEFVVRYLR
jgi:acyl dehydratase